MALTRRNNTYYIRLSHNGRRIQKSTKTGDKIIAMRMHDELKVQLWRTENLKEKPKHLWFEAAIRWLNESQHKRSLKDDKAHLRWLDAHLRNIAIQDMTREQINKIATLKAESVKPATVNRMLALVRAILRKAEKEWLWIDKAPAIRMWHEERGRIRWLTVAETERLLNELPFHLSDLAAFSLATGLRQSNVTGLKWRDVDLVNHHLIVHADQAKGKTAIPVPLNSEAIAILRKQIGKHCDFVFTYRRNKIIQCNTRAWRAALKRAGIDNFRWHDLRHTWASRHVQNGTTLHELQQLGGWKDYSMTLRYAHLSSAHLKTAAERITKCGSNWVHPKLSLVKNSG